MSRTPGQIRTIAPVALAAILVITAVAPFAYSQKKAPAKRAPVAKTAPAPATPFAQGYQAGYNDGFTQGETDWSNRQDRDFRRSDKWQQRDTTTAEEYREGYDIGFEIAYSDGYFGRARSAAVPRNAEVVAALSTQRARRQRDAMDDRRRDTRDARDNRDNNDRRSRDTYRQASGPLNVPNGTELRIRLSSPISTKSGRVGDTFKATVVSPSTYETATVEGHIATLNKSGRISGKTEVGLAFDSITASDGRYARIDADLVRIYESENVKRVDEEGRVETGSRTRDSEVRGGVGAAAGAILGGIVGGGKGALIGLIVGGAAGVGSVYVDGNKDLILDPGTEMVIRVVAQKDR